MLLGYRKKYTVVVVFICVLSDSWVCKSYLVNYGFIRSEYLSKIYLTIDFCPSSQKGIDEQLFSEIVNISKKRNRPIPVGISISGRWIQKHSDGLKKIKNLEKDGYIKVTWINHGYQHYYNPELPIEQNFMLHNMRDAQGDFTKNRLIMLENHLTPSQFIRFPGLISNKLLNLIVEKMGYKVLGAGAWLAKTNGKFNPGDIILVHGNLNEPDGVRFFIEDSHLGKFDYLTFGDLKDFS